MGNSLSFFQTGATSADESGGMTTGAYDLRILGSHKPPQFLNNLSSNTGFLSTHASNTTGHGTLDYGVYAAPDYDGDGNRDSLNTPEGSGLPQPGTNTSFGIFGISENATAFTDYDLLTLHHNGRRWGDSSLYFASRNSSIHENLPSDLTNDRLDLDQQLAYNATFSFGYQRKENYQSVSYVNDFFDGDISEIVWYNRQLSNTQIALVEGYLAHKYGIQDDLIHKDGSGDHPYKYQTPPAIGANNTPY